MSVAKVDGFGVRLLGTTTQANTENRGKFVRMYASEAITKGDLVALDFSATEPANGYGNHVLKCDTGDALNMHAVGIAAETIAAASTLAPISIQVYGLCTFAVCSNIADSGAAALADADEGQLLTASAEAGRLRDYDAGQAVGSGGDSLPVCILIEYGTADTADSTVFLLNPANL